MLHGCVVDRLQRNLTGMLADMQSPQARAELLLAAQRHFHGGIAEAFRVETGQERPKARSDI
jgi:hypothetical protein